MVLAVRMFLLSPPSYLRSVRQIEALDRERPKLQFATVLLLSLLLVEEIMVTRYDLYPAL